MGDIKLFRYGDDKAGEIPFKQADMEKELQYIFEKNMQAFLGIRLLAHEYPTTRPQRGFIDSLGLDENCCPVIIEYKKANNENVITQGLYYLDWLLSHKAEFTMLALEKLGKEILPIEFAGSRILCIASSFGRYDEHAIMQIDKNIELIRYRLYEGELILLERLNTSLGIFQPDKISGGEIQQDCEIGMPASLQERIRCMNPEIEDLYLEVLSYAENLGDDVSIKFMKHYVACARLKNFTCIQPTRNFLKLWLNLNPENIILEEGFSRDVSSIGHHASGNVQVDVKDQETFIKAQPLIEMAYALN